MMYENPPPNKEEFEKVCKEMEYEHSQLTLRHVGRVFGQSFWEIMVLALADARDTKAILSDITKDL